MTAEGERARALSCDEALRIALPFMDATTLYVEFGDHLWTREKARAAIAAALRAPQPSGLPDEALSAISIEHERDHDDDSRGLALPREGCNGCRLIAYAWSLRDRLEAAPQPSGTFDKLAADRLADEVAVLVRRGIIDSRSPAADALLDYRTPPSTPRADRLAALESPQPSGLTGDAIRSAIEQAALATEAVHVNEKMVAAFQWNNIAANLRAALRALNLSAIEGAPAAGEREAVEGLSRFQYAHVIEAWAKAFDAAGGNEPAVNAARKMAALLRGEVVWPWTVPAFIAPASPRSAAPEDK